MYEIMYAEPVPIHEVTPDCPEVLAKIVRRALEKDRESRYQSVRDLIIDTAPILLRLKRSKANELLTKTKVLFEEGQVDSALAQIDDVLALDASNNRARVLRESVQERIRQQTLGTRIDRLISDGAASIERRNYSEALKSFEVALRLDPTNDTIRKRIEEAKNLAVAAQHQSLAVTKGDETSVPASKLEEGPTSFFKATVFSKTRFFKEDNVRFDKIQETLEFYRDHLTREYQALSKQAQVTYCLWVGCVVFGFGSLLAGVVTLLLGYLSRGALTTASTVIVYFIQRVFQQREDHYRSLATAKHQHLEYGNQWLLVIQSIDSIQDERERLNRQSRLCEVLTEKLRKAAPVKR